MAVERALDLSLRDSGKRLISSLKATDRYSKGYLETTVSMAALYAEEQGWSSVSEITVSHFEDYLAYLK